MASHSKIYYDKAFMNLKCSDIFHPWSPSCVYGSAELILNMLLGSLKFFSIPYAAQLFLKRRAKKKINLKDELKGFIRSIMFAFTFVIGFVSLNCALRHFLGVLNYYVYMYIAPITCGLGIFIENPERRNITATTFVTMFLESLYLNFLSKNRTKYTKFGETLVFMVLNGLLMSLIRKERTEGHKVNNWLFLPEKIKSTGNEENLYSTEGLAKNECGHANSCSANLKKELIKYGSITMLISLVKLSIANIKSPSTILKQMLQWRNLRLTATILFYIGVYRVTSCFLCKQKGDSLENTFLSGALAGLSYAINYNKTFLFSVLTVLIQMTGTHIKRKYSLPNLPYTEISFILANASLFHTTICGNDIPRYFRYLTAVFSNNKISILLNKIDEVLNKA